MLDVVTLPTITKLLLIFIWWTVHHYSLYLITIQETQPLSLVKYLSVYLLKMYLISSPWFTLSVWYAFYTKRIQIKIRTIVLLTWELDFHPIIITSPLFALSNIDDCCSLVAKYSPNDDTFFFFIITITLLPFYFTVTSHKGQ